jgi:hypothetical protein
VRPDPGGASDDSKLIGFWMFFVRVTKDLIGSPIGWQKALQTESRVGRLFRLGVFTAFALCNNFLTLIHVDVSMRRHRVKIRR